MSTWVGVFFRIDTRQITRIVIPDTDAGLKNHAAGPGEQMVRFSRAIYQTLNSHQDVAAYLALAG